MTKQKEQLLDEIGWQILQALQENARLSFRELGQRIGLVASAVAERVHRMEDDGIIQGYHASIQLPEVGLPITAFIRMNTSGKKSAHLGATLCERPEVLECYRLTGSETFLMRVGVPSIEHLEVLIDHFSQYGQPTTSIVLSTPLTRRSIDEQTIHPQE